MANSVLCFLKRVLYGESLIYNQTAHVLAGQEQFYIYASMYFKLSLFSVFFFFSIVSFVERFSTIYFH